MQKIVLFLFLTIIVPLIPSQYVFADVQIVNSWTEITPSFNSKVIHVSTQDDDGFSQNSPVKTIQHVISLLCDGYSDYLLLKTDDTWVNEKIGIWEKSGCSENEPMVVGSYGVVDRPVIMTGDLVYTRGEKTTATHVSFICIEYISHTRDDGKGPHGIRWLAPGNDILFEDMFIHEYQTNIIVQTFYGPINDVKIRKSIITDAYSTISHSRECFLIM